MSSVAEMAVKAPSRARRPTPGSTTSCSAGSAVRCCSRSTLPAHRAFLLASSILPVTWLVCVVRPRSPSRSCAYTSSTECHSFLLSRTRQLGMSVVLRPFPTSPASCAMFSTRSSRTVAEQLWMPARQTSTSRRGPSKWSSALTRGRLPFGYLTAPKASPSRWCPECSRTSSPLHAKLRKPRRSTARLRLLQLSLAMGSACHSPGSMRGTLADLLDWCLGLATALMCICSFRD
mmetsp:Transcript_45583/g.108437  ORF Transcript_45583/g.108437 Transcript_45583/m.108437 type:complete len:233 (-) Transcript_45583:150-848(-)